MRPLIVCILIGMGASSGCGGSRQEIHTSSSVPLATPQQQLDGIGAGILGRLTGGIF